MRALHLLLTATLFGACDASTVDSVYGTGGETPEQICELSCQAFLACVEGGTTAGTCAAAPCAPGGTVCETAQQVQARKQAVANRRERNKLLVAHRGSTEFGHENSLEALRATMELGADGNEIDINRTSDGVLVLFHDAYLDRISDGVGLLHTTSWPDLQRIPLNHPGKWGEKSRIPTLAEVFDLHRRMRGLIHLDIKIHGFSREIAQLLDILDMWDHVIWSNDYNANAILTSPKYQPIAGMVDMTAGRMDVDPQRVANVVKGSGRWFFLDDPRPALLALGRGLKAVSQQPVRQESWPTSPPTSSLSPGQVLEILRDDGGWNELPQDPTLLNELAGRILWRAKAAIAARNNGYDSLEIRDALVERVLKRSLHRDPNFHGLDGKEALHSLFALGDPRALALARDVVFMSDPAVEPISFPGYSFGFVDWRIKGIVWPSLAQYAGEGGRSLCRDYLAISNQRAAELGFDAFVSAATTLLSLSPTKETALELLKHRRSDVRGTIMLKLLRRINQPWARAALEAGAPHALGYLPPAG
jgi:glycerophosphoryl diester phosphodiesterase